MKKNCIYVIIADGGLVKIGISEDLKQRFANLQGQSPVKLTLAHYRYCEQAREIERQVHGRLSAYRVRGEWFRAPLVFIVATIDEVIRQIPPKRALAPSTQCPPRAAAIVPGIIVAELE